MKETTIKIAGRETGVAYCYATEIAFRDYTGQDINDFIRELLPDAEGMAHTAAAGKVLYAILAAVMAYYQKRQEEPAVKDRDIMFDATPEELVAAFSAVIRLHNDWYRTPAGEEAGEEAGDGAKN